jgi:AraC-like DNA-binding protein
MPTTRRSPSPPSFPITSTIGDVRIGPVMAVPELLTEFGVTPGRAFSRAGVRPSLFRSPDGRIPLEALARLLSVCASLTECGHFGLLVGERFRLEALGPLGLLMRNSNTVGEALRALLLHLHLYDRGAVPVLQEVAPSRMLLGYAAYGQGARSTAQVYDAALAMGLRTLQELCGPSCIPLHVQFSHVRPRNVSAYRGLFRCRLRFNAEACGIVFASRWLEEPVPGADPSLRDRLTRVIENAEKRTAMSFAEQVECALTPCVLNGATSAEDVARLFGIHDRTLRKRLRADGTNLQKLLDRTRFGLARQLLRDTGLSVTDVSGALHFSDPDVFSRAFRNWAGVSPRQWRNGLPGSDSSAH